MSEGQFWKVNSRQSADAFKEYIDQLYQENKYLEFHWTAGKQRSRAQNNALHLWLGRLCKVLNEAGLDMVTALDKLSTRGVHIPWTVESAKNHLWRPVQRKMFEQESTTKPNTKQYVEIYKVLDEALQSKFGADAHVEWPTSD